MGLKHGGKFFKMSYSLETSQPTTLSFLEKQVHIMYQPKRMFPTFEMMIGRGKCNMKLPTAQWG